jgi:hypothetical protein
MKISLRRFLSKRAKYYLEREGVLVLLLPGSSGEIPPDYLDLATLHRLVRRKRPQTVLEFGVGFSTIVLAHALKQNGEGRLYGVETDRPWLENLQAKLPADLAPLISIRHSPARAAVHEGELCHYYDTLPDIVPDLIYLDGPDNFSVEGSVRGLTFQPETGARHQVAADILLYESSLKTGATIFVDSRYNNVHFLKRRLRRNWQVKIDRLRRQSTFILAEHTGKR